MMNKVNLKKQAEYYKTIYNSGYIDIEMAREMIQPYLNVINAEREKIAKGYGRYFEKITFEKFIKNT